MKSTIKELKQDMIDELKQELDQLKSKIDKPFKRQDYIFTQVKIEGTAAKLILDTIREKRGQGKSRYGYKSAIQCLLCELEEYRKKYPKAA